MSVAKARENLKGARRELADAIDVLPRSIFSRARKKRGKIKRAMDTIDRTLENLRGL